MVALARSPTSASLHGYKTRLFPMLWLGLLPSQLRMLSAGELQLRPLSTRDESLLETLQEEAKEWHESVMKELEEMRHSGRKAELQCLFDLRIGSKREVVSEM